MFRRFAVASLLAGMLVGLTGIANAAHPLADTRAERHAQIVAHWTPARMAAATPRDFVFDSRRGFVPTAKPTTPGGAKVTITGASWTKGGAIDQVSGKVYFEMNGGAYICSGAVVKDTRADISLVLTAGHCAYDQANHVFATNWMFIPDFDAVPSYDCGATAYGCWTAEALVVDSGFANADGFTAQATRHDYAFAVVGLGGENTTELDVTVGKFDIQYSNVSSGNTLYAFGYPAAGKYHGNDLTYCAGRIGTDQYNANNTWSMTCDMTGGSSGGPWLANFNEKTGVGVLSSLNSYGYSGIKNMYGPKFNANTQATFAVADAASGNTVVTVAP